MTELTGTDSKSTLYCSFCGKSQHEVRKLIAGPTVFICDECVELCNDIIREETKAGIAGKKEGDIPTPSEIFATLNDYVIQMNADSKDYFRFIWHAAVSVVKKILELYGRFYRRNRTGEFRYD